MPITKLEPSSKSLLVLLAPTHPLPPPPAPPPVVYGRLSFAGLAGPQDKFYRYESFPTSKRINRRTRQIAPGTFASPASELALIPRGFAAVARYALPSLFPARWR
jgi:hypothetical protein